MIQCQQNDTKYEKIMAADIVTTITIIIRQQEIGINDQ
jgi:hypothetical protein